MYDTGIHKLGRMGSRSSTPSIWFRQRAWRNENTQYSTCTVYKQSCTANASIPFAVTHVPLNRCEFAAAFQLTWKRVNFDTRKESRLRENFNVHFVAWIRWVTNRRTSNQSLTFQANSATFCSCNIIWFLLLLLKATTRNEAPRTMLLLRRSCLLLTHQRNRRGMPLAS